MALARSQDYVAGTTIVSSEVDAEFTELYSAIGTQTFTEQNYVTDDESVTSSLDALDQALADVYSTTARETLIDVVQASDDGIADNDTLDLVFSTVPSEITLDWTIRQLHDTSNEVGMNTGHTLVTVTGTDTITLNMNSNGLYDNNGTLGTSKEQDNTTYIVKGHGGHDGVDAAEVTGTAAWVTATKTLTITFQESNTTTASSFIDIMATAYL